MSCTISKFGLREATECTMALRKIGQNCRSMEEAAAKIVDLFYNSFTDETGLTRDFSLVRLFKTHAFGKLNAGLKKFAGHCFPDEVVNNTTKCLTLLATTGDDETWKSRENSKGHKAIPLSSEDVVNKLPMIRNLIKQLGLDVKTVINPDPEIIKDMAEKTYNVFLVPDASGSPYIPAQNEFVIPFHIKSVLGFGGVLPDGEIFVVIIFSKKCISGDVAALFKTIALSIKVSLLPFMGKTFS
jgi:two-component system, NtrC family, sensor kinase